MTTPISGSELKKLTRRLRDGTETPEDLHALADVRMYYAIRNLATMAQKRVVHALDTANHYLEQLP